MVTDLGLIPGTLAAAARVEALSAGVAVGMPGWIREGRMLARGCPLAGLRPGVVSALVCHDEAGRGDVVWIAGD